MPARARAPPHPTTTAKGGIVLIAMLFIAAVALAYANGANDNFKAAATMYGSSTHSYKRSLVLATAAQLTGSALSILLAWSLVKAFGGKGLVPDSVVANPAFLVSVGGGAALTVLLATRIGMPISTTHAMIGGLVGAGFALAPADLQIAVLGKKYFLPLLTSPFLALFAAALIYPAARFTRRRLSLVEETCVCVGDCYEPVIDAGGGTLIFERTGIALEVGEREQCARRYSGSVLGFSAQTFLAAAHTVSAFTLGVARGLNDTPKVLALLVAGRWAGLDARLSLAALAGAMALGGFLHSRKLAETMGKKITDMNQGQGFVANAVSGALVIGASLLGSPVSTTHVSTGAIFGIGIWSGRSSKGVIGEIVLSWVATLPVAALLAWAVAISLRTTA